MTHTDRERSLAIIADILREIERAEEKWPGFPTDPVHAAAVVAEEAGELVQAALRATYESAAGTADAINEELMMQEATHTAATAVRFLLAMPEWERRPSPQK